MLTGRPREEARAALVKAEGSGSNSTAIDAEIEAIAEGMKQLQQEQRASGISGAVACGTACLEGGMRGQQNFGTRACHSRAVQVERIAKSMKAAATRAGSSEDLRCACEGGLRF